MKIKIKLTVSKMFLCYCKKYKIINLNIYLHISVFLHFLHHHHLDLHSIGKSVTVGLICGIEVIHTLYQPHFIHKTLQPYFFIFIRLQTRVFVLNARVRSFRILNFRRIRIFTVVDRKHR